MNDIIFLLDPTQEGVASTHTQEEAVRQIPLYGTEIFLFIYFFFKSSPVGLTCSMMRLFLFVLLSDSSTLATCHCLFSLTSE